jgi:hypothetical protein
MHPRQCRPLQLVNTRTPASGSIVHTRRAAKTMDVSSVRADEATENSTPHASLASRLDKSLQGCHVLALVVSAIT